MSLDEEIKQEYYSKFHTNSLLIKGFLQNETECLKKLNKPQREALLSLSSHQPANGQNISIIVLPTGTGKSGVAALAPYVLASNRVLVITPSHLITEQLFNDMAANRSGQTFYEQRGMFSAKKINDISELCYIMPNGTNEDIFNSQCSAYKLVIANAHKFNDASNVNISQIRQDLFDLVIVDEAHHYPAPTWKKIIDHFRDARKLFLTATPLHTSNNEINPVAGDDFADQLANYITYKLMRIEAIEMGIIRDIDFDQVGYQDDDEDTQVTTMIETIINNLNQHDRENNYQHQAMVLVRSKNRANIFEEAYNQYPERIGTAVAYHSNVGNDDFENFRNGTANVRVLIVCGKALEGFDRKEISVLGIWRNVHANSLCLFTQFIGRGIRRHPQDSAGFKCVLISHVKCEQETNFEKFKNENYVPQEDPESDREE